MNIARNLIVAVLMTIVTTVLLGVIYPLAITGIAQVAFPDQANGQLIEQNGKVVGSRLIGQGFSSPRTQTGVGVRVSRRYTSLDSVNAADTEVSNPGVKEKYRTTESPASTA